MKICKQCNIEYEDNMKFCPECGSKLEDVRNTCPNCGTEYKEGQKFCSECGQKLECATQSSASNFLNGDVEELFQKGYSIYKKENTGTTIEENKKAIESLTIAAETGHARAIYYLANCYAFGRLRVSRNKEKAEQLYKKALPWYQIEAKNGDTQAQSELAELYWHGDGGVVKDEEYALELHEKAGKSGLIDSQLRLATIYTFGNRRNWTKSAYWFEMAARSGDVKSQYIISDLYSIGFGLEKDTYKAIQWRKKADEFKTPEVLNSIGSLYSIYFDDTEFGASKSFEYYKLAVDCGHIASICKLALCYKWGSGIDKNKEEAFNLYKKAALLDFTDAYIPLAECYKKGEGVKQDTSEALKWYKKASELGSAKGYYGLAEFYMECQENRTTEAIRLYEKAAELGYEDAFKSLGYLYLYDKSVEHDGTKALHWFEKYYNHMVTYGVEFADKYVLYLIGECYYLLKDFSKAYECFKKSAKAGSEHAQSKINAYFDSNGALNEDLLVLQSLLHEAETGNVDAQYKLAQKYESGKGMLSPQKKEADKWYYKAAEAGHVDAQYKYWYNHKFHYNGYFGEDDNDKEFINPIIWLIKAADSGHVEACNELGMAYLYGQYGLLQSDIPMAVKYFTQGAEKGNLDSMYYIGYCYYYHKDHLVGPARLAREWYEKAALAGHIQSQFCVAEIYDSITYVENSKAKAIAWYKKAAEQGHKRAQYKLAQHYASGNGVEKDIFAACKWYEKATEGDSDVDTHSIDYLDKWNKQGAQYDIGCYYYYGNGVKRDFDKAESWFSKAAEDGHEESKKMLEKVKEEKAYYTEGASTNANSVNNFAIDRCVPHVFYIKSVGIDITMPDGSHKSMSCGIGGDFSGWTGTGMLLNDGRFVTARHVVEPWSFCMNGGEVDEGQLGLNIIANNGGKVVARFNAISSTGVQISFTSDQCTINRWNDKITLVKDGKKVVIATLDNTDYAYFRSGRSEGLPFNTMLSTNLLRGTKLEVLGFPLGLGANSATDINPIYGSGIVAVNGLQNGVILTTDTNYEQGNSGGPVFKANVNGVLEVIGLVSAGAGRVTGFIVPIAAVK